jgi:hypothetical protein
MDMAFTVGAFRAATGGIPVLKIMTVQQSAIIIARTIAAFKAAY